MAWTRDTVAAWMRANLTEPFRSSDVCRRAAQDPNLGHWSNGQGVLGALRRFNLVHRTRMPKGFKGFYYEYRFGPEPEAVDAVAKRIALTTLLTFKAARHGLDLLLARGATVEQAETIVRLGVAPVAAELLDRMREDHARLQQNGIPDLPAAGGKGDDHGRLAGEAPGPRRPGE